MHEGHHVAQKFTSTTLPARLSILTLPPPKRSVVNEGTLSPVPCLDYEVNSCPRSNACITLDVWRQIHEAVQNVVDHITLADLVLKYHNESNSNGLQPCCNK